MRSALLAVKGLDSSLEHAGVADHIAVCEVYSTQRINVLFKSIKSKYNLKIEHFSTHSMRKTFGRRVVEAAGENSEFALIKLSELFNHADVMTTRRYLGLRTQELLETYDMLSF